MTRIAWDEELTHIHPKHMGQMVIHVLFLGGGGELLGNGILPLTSDQFSMFLGVQTMGDFVA